MFAAFIITGALEIELVMLFNTCMSNECWEFYMLRLNDVIKMESFWNHFSHRAFLVNSKSSFSGKFGKFYFLFNVTKCIMTALLELAKKLTLNCIEKFSHTHDLKTFRYTFKNEIHTISHVTNSGTKTTVQKVLW